MERLGTVLVFAEGVTKAEAEAAMERIADVIATDYYVERKGANYVATAKPKINTFESDYGGPVWYVP